MAVIKVTPRWDLRGGGTDETGVRTLNRGWLVETNNQNDCEPHVVNGLIAVDPTAALFAPHPYWPYAVCRNIEPKPHEGPKVWVVTAKYSTAPFKANGDGSGDASNPTSPSESQSNSTPADERSPTINVTRKEVTKVLEKDVVSGARVVNVVGDPFDPAPEVFRSHHLITAKFYRSVSALAWATRSQFMDSINLTAVSILGRTYPARTLRCTDYAPDTVWETGASGMTFFFVLTVQCEFNPDGWQPKILNTGRRKRGASSSDPITMIVDANGQPVSDPVPLTSAGVPVPPGTAPEDYHYVEPKGYVEKEWNGTGGLWTGAGGILA